MGRGGAGGAIVRRQSIASISSANCADVKANVPWTHRVSHWGMRMRGQTLIPTQVGHRFRNDVGR